MHNRPATTLQADNLKPIYRTSCLLLRLGVFCFLFLPLLLQTSCKKNQSTPNWEGSAESAPQIERVENSKQADPKKPAVVSTDTTSTAAQESTTFVCYNLRNYLTMERSVDGKLQPAGKPEREIIDLLTLIQQLQPDILGVSEIGSMEDLEDFQARLKKVGMDFPYIHHSTGSDSIRQQAILSKYPITPHTKADISYTMNGRSWKIRRGILDVSIATPSGSIRFMGVHLKSKRPNSQFDQEMMRRHEAYTLRKHIVKVLEKSPQQKLIVYGDFNDTKRSASFRAVRGPSTNPHYLWPIDIYDANKTNWTHHWKHQDVYSRIDFILTNKPMRRHILHKKSLIQDTTNFPHASDHRPLKIEFK